jgi:hypothetical protein
MDGNDGRYDEPQLRAADDQYSPRHHNLDSRKEGAASLVSWGRHDFRISQESGR